MGFFLIMQITRNSLKINKNKYVYCALCLVPSRPKSNWLQAPKKKSIRFPSNKNPPKKWRRRTSPVRRLKRSFASVLSISTHVPRTMTSLKAPPPPHIGSHRWRPKGLEAYRWYEAPVHWSGKHTYRGGLRTTGSGGHASNVRPPIIPYLNWAQFEEPVIGLLASAKRTQ